MFDTFLLFIKLRQTFYTSENAQKILDSATDDVVAEIRDKNSVANKYWLPNYIGNCVVAGRIDNVAVTNNFIREHKIILNRDDIVREINKVHYNNSTELEQILEFMGIEKPPFESGYMFRSKPISI